jgi:hypothetical protein
MRRLLLLLALAPAWSAGCQSTELQARTETPHDYRLSFRDGSFVRKQASMAAVLTLASGQEVWVRLEASNGELAAAAASRWAEALNARAANLATASSNTLVLHRVVAVELRGVLRGVRLKDLGESA